MSEETIFIDGLIFKKPSAEAPKWVLWNISIKVEDFKQFLEDRDNGTGWLNIDVKESRGGKVYCALNTYKKGDAPSKKVDIKDETGPEIESEDDEIPF